MHVLVLVLGPHQLVDDESKHRRRAPADTRGMLDHEKLDVYRLSLQLAARAFEITDHLPRGYGCLAEQLRKAAISVPANIAEACGRRHGKEREHFMGIARGSAAECAALIDLCLLKADLPAVPEAKQHVVRVVQMLTRLCR